MKLILFWILIFLMTVLAWSFVVVPVFANFKMRSSNWVKYIVWVFPFIAFGLYLGFGHWSLLQNTWQQAQLDQVIQKKMAAIKDPQQLVEDLKVHLQQKPQSAQGWYLLGKLYLSMNRNEEAENALQKAYQIEPENDEYILTMAEANLLTHHQFLSQSIEDNLKNYLQKHPDSVRALNILAISAFQNKQYHQAVHYWQSALNKVPEGSSDSQTLLKMIGLAQQHEVDN